MSRHQIRRKMNGGRVSVRAHVNKHFFERTGREVLRFFEWQQRPAAAQLARAAWEFGNAVAAAHLKCSARSRSCRAPAPGRASCPMEIRSQT
jgi:hypothetical protein